MTDNKQLLKAWKESGTDLSFNEWKIKAASQEQDNNITPAPENITLDKKEYPKKKERWATSGETGKLVRIKNWDEYFTKKSLYLSKLNYDRLLKTKSVSKQVNQILNDYFDWADKNKFSKPKDERGEDDRI